MNRSLVPGTLGRVDTQRKISTIAIFGSTGSIGRSTLEVVRRSSGRLSVECLVFGENYDLALEQIKEFSPKYVGTSSVSVAQKLSQVLSSEIKVVVGESEISALIKELNSECIVAGIVGVAGLRYVIEGLRANKRIALANKESLVAAGAFVSEVLNSTKSEIIPVDSEHSALFQCLSRVTRSDLSSLILTASGGPFWSVAKERFPGITPQEAVRHPRWSMGAKISIDSATLFNKGLELIEAYWLYGVSQSQIEVVVHRQSIVHSIVRLVDGTQLAQLSLPDMNGAISYAITYPGDRLPNVVEQLDWEKVGTLTFEKLDDERFPAVKLARQALDNPRLSPLVYNISNEIAVALFQRGALRFSDIPTFVEFCLERFSAKLVTNLSDVFALNEEILRSADQLCQIYREKVIWV